MKIIRGLDMVKCFSEDIEAKELAEKVIDFVNSFTCDTEGFIESMKYADLDVKRRFTTISFMWIQKLNYFLREDWYDERNKYSVDIAKSIDGLLEGELIVFAKGYEGAITNSQYKYEVYADNEPILFEILFVERMSRSHRTLQQTFSSIVFQWLDIMESVGEDSKMKKVGKKISNFMPDKYWCTPMI